MNTKKEENQEKSPYSVPKTEVWVLSPKLNLLEYLSLEGDVSDFEDGDDI